MSQIGSAISRALPSTCIVKAASGGRRRWRLACLSFTERPWTTPSNKPVKCAPKSDSMQNKWRGCVSSPCSARDQGLSRVVCVVVLTCGCREEEINHDDQSSFFAQGRESRLYHSDDAAPCVGSCRQCWRQRRLHPAYRYWPCRTCPGSHRFHDALQRPVPGTAAALQGRAARRSRCPQ